MSNPIPMSNSAIIMSNPTTPIPHPARPKPPPSLEIRLGINRVVFLVTEIPCMPELDVLPVGNCLMRLRFMPGLLLESSTQHIVCPLLLDRGIISTELQLLTAASERENPFYGLSAFAKIRETANYLSRVPETPSAHLPARIVADLCPTEFGQLATTADDAPILVNFHLPTGYPLPEICPGKIVRLSVNTHTRSGGLAPNGQPLFLNSLSRPTHIHYPPSSGLPVSDYFRLKITDRYQSVTSDLPSVYEDYTDALDPNAALLARHGIKR